MFSTPSTLVLGSYSDDFNNSIKRFGGKLGVLEYLSRDSVLSKKIYDLGIAIFPHLNPIIISNQNSISEEEYENFTKQMDFLKARNNGLNRLTNGDALLRVSAPGDFRSFVDIFPTDTLNDLSVDGINLAISNIKSKINSITPEIKAYANGTGVPYNERDLSFGIVGKMNVPILTATENPNTEEIYIDNYYGENGAGKTINSEIDTPLNRTNNGKKIRSFLELLRNEGILDKNIAYQIEFGQLNNGTLVLFQIKEFTRKIPIISSVRGSIWIYINKIISGSDILNYSLPIIYGNNSREGYEKLKLTGENAVLALGYNGTDLRPGDYSPNAVGFIHGDSHRGVFIHNSFRTSQAVLQKGGVAMLGIRYNSVLEDLKKELTLLDVKSSKGRVDVRINEKKAA